MCLLALDSWCLYLGILCLGGSQRSVGGCIVVVIAGGVAVVVGRVVVIVVGIEVLDFGVQNGALEGRQILHTEPQ